MSILSLYRQTHTLNLVRQENQLHTTGNTPMNNQTIKVHKGVDNEITVRVSNLDRKPVSVDDLEVFARIVNPQNGEQVLIKPLEATNQRGVLKIKIYEGELSSIPQGLYDMVVIGTQDFVPGVKGDVTYTPLYVNTGDDIRLTLEITNQGVRDPVPSVVVLPSDWRAVRRGSSPSNNITELFSSAYPASQVRNHVNSLHTFAVFAEKFTGTLTVLGTLDLQPPEDPGRWFAVDLTTASNFVEFYEYTGSMSFSFSANFMWLMFKQTPGVLPIDSALAGSTGMTASAFANVANFGNQTQAATLISLNQSFLTAELNSFLTSTAPSIFNNADIAFYNQQLGNLIPALVQDLISGGTTNTQLVAEDFFNLGNPVLSPKQAVPVAQSFQVLAALIAQVIRNQLVSPPRQTLQQQLIDGSQSVPDTQQVDVVIEGLLSALDQVLLYPYNLGNTGEITKIILR